MSIVLTAILVLLGLAADLSAPSLAYAAIRFNG